MPAYRSEAEAEIRGPVVERLRQIIPGCRIIHEVNAASFGNRIDVMAVGTESIATVEIKSAKDKLKRMPDQVAAMRSVSNLVYVAIHERFLDVNEKFGWVSPPKEARGAVTWVWPIADRGSNDDCNAFWLPRHRWEKPMTALPPGAIGLLWRKELQDIAASIGAKGVSSMNMDVAQDYILWRMTGQELARAICGKLRERACVEADDPIRQPTSAT